MSKVNDYKQKCATCTRISLNRNNSQGKFYCHQYNLYVDLNDNCKPTLFGGYSFNKSITDKEIEYAEKKVRENNNCYITTIVCNILNHSDDSYILNTLRYFRNNVLQKNSKYFPLLINYDAVGPKIAQNIALDPNKKDIANQIMQNYLIPCTRIIINEPDNYEEAINIYKQMTEKLANIYNISNNYISIPISNDKIKKLGHGKVLIKN